MFGPPEIFDFRPNQRTFGMPEYQARPGLFLQAKEIKFLANPPMVALLRLL